MTKYTTAQVAILLGIKAGTVRSHIAHGVLQAEYTRGKYWITQEELDRFQAERRKSGQRITKPCGRQERGWQWRKKSTIKI